MDRPPIRCPWCLGTEEYVRYHDEEWGVPVHDDRVLFEFLILEGAQAGLSWLTILRKRAGYRKAFSDFDPKRVARITEARREFGEHGGVAPSIERSSTFTVMEPGLMPDIFEGHRSPDRDGCYLYSRHFNPTVSVLDRYLALR